MKCAHCSCIRNGVGMMTVGKLAFCNDRGPCQSAGRAAGRTSPPIPIEVVQAPMAQAAA